MSSENPADRNYDLINNAPATESTQYGCVENPFYSLRQPSNSIVPTADNRSYMAYATKPGYRGYYDERCLSNPSTFVPCDLKYVYAPPLVDQQCWKKCDTVPCHNSCVVGNAK